MDGPAGSASLKRTSSQHSHASGKSARSQTIRGRPRKFISHMSSSNSSTNTSASTSDKSLTSFPSFSPESPRKERAAISRINYGDKITTGLGKPLGYAPHPDGNLTLNSLAAKARSALFDDAPLTTTNLPGTIHNLTTEQIENLIARTGAVALVRQIAGDLAERDIQIANIRRKAEEKERAMRKIILECGLSNLDLETRLRTIEEEQKAFTEASNNQKSKTGLEDLMSDAMKSTVILSKKRTNNDSTIRAVDKLRELGENPRTVSKGWKEYLWGGTSRKSSRASSINGDSSVKADTTTTWTGSSNSGRKTVFQNGLFQPLEAGESMSRESSQQRQTGNTSHHERKPSSSLTALAFKLVTASVTAGRDVDSDLPRDRSCSAGTSLHKMNSIASIRTTNSARTLPLKSVLAKVPPQNITGSRRVATSSKLGQNTIIRASQEKKDQKIASSCKTESDISGPVEMDTILPLDDQPPTLSQVYHMKYKGEFLTDPFGFIYDHRRKKRQKEAEMTRRLKRGNRLEMLSGTQCESSMNQLEADLIEEIEERPYTPISVEGTGDEDEKPIKRWQDHLKIATFTTELLLHTPSGAVSDFEVAEGYNAPRSPSIITEERGFIPSASTTSSQSTLVVTSDNSTKSNTATNTTPSSKLLKEDTEPVKLLLMQLGEVHNSLQREKTIRWNDFLRKVRAERKRDGEAAAALPANSESRTTRPVEIMPEVNLAVGEMIGVAGLGNKGKVGRAKWNEFKALILGGIPVAYRAKIWGECSGASTLRIPGYYDSLIDKPKVNDDPVIVAQIQMDINRTLTDNIYFRKGPGVSKLNEVLLAYSRRNAEVGYCQGMNLITACLLLIMPTAEEAFWLLTSIIENILPQGYYDHSLLASRADQQVLRQYVSEILPRLSGHLDSLGVELEALTFQWFLSVFTDCLSAEALFRVWDVVLCTNDGSTFLFQVALALLKLNEPQLMQCETPASVYTYINHQMTNHAISIDGLIHASEGLRKVVKREVVEDRRSKAIETEKAYVRKREELNALKRVKKLSAVEATKAMGEGTEDCTSDASSPSKMLKLRTSCLEEQAVE
ncbi:hypothetical protein K3495_g378 [Podosphaera aphanis]|nr:hypothetical protein K3495_g378 [Podosphaera aphanis]